VKIVVVDDDPVARLLIEVTLTSMGHSVVACESGEEAAEAVLGTGAHVVVSDWMMPGMDGLELCRRLKGASHPVYFILVSSTLTNAQRERQATDAGVDQCVFKSSMPDELGRRVRDLEQHLVS